MKKHNGLKRFLTAILVLILLLAAVFAVMMYLVPATETVDQTAVEGSADWMAELPGDLKLSEVVLPGTHDSATKDVFLAYFSKCQTLDFTGQLEAGFRYLDMRLAVDGSGFKLMHGFAQCKEDWWPFAKTLQLETVLTQCYRFLDAHPTETVVFAVKQEHGSEPVSQFETSLAEILKKDAKYWLLTDRIPTVEEARGKLVLMRRYEDEAGLGKESGIPLRWGDQGGRADTEKHIEKESNGTYTLWVQDRYKYETGEKWNAFVQGLDGAVTGPEDLAIHFLSTNGSPKFGHPYQYARDLNQMVYTLERNLSGWVIVDFASPALAALIYRENF